MKTAAFLLFVCLGAAPAAWAWQPVDGPGPRENPTTTGDEADGQLKYNGAQPEVGEVRLKEGDPRQRSMRSEEVKGANAIASNDPAAREMGARAVAGVALAEQNERMRPLRMIGTAVIVFLAGLLSVLGIRYWAEKAGPRMPEKKAVRW